MDNLRTLTFHKTRRIGRITLNRPERDNGITLEMPAELAECVEKANLDPEVHVIALFGTGKGFCGGYDLIAAAEQRTLDEGGDRWPRGSPMDTCVQLENHMPDRIWDPITKSLPRRAGRANPNDPGRWIRSWRPRAWERGWSYTCLNY